MSMATLVLRILPSEKHEKRWSVRIKRPQKQRTASFERSSLLVFLSLLSVRTSGKGRESQYRIRAPSIE